MGGCGVLPQAIGKISWHGRRSPRRACHVRATGSNGPHKAVLKTAGFLATLSVIASPVQSNAEELTIKFPASPIPEVRKSQGSMVEAWAYASIEFFDPSLNGLGLDGWKAALKSAIADTTRMTDPAEVTKATDDLMKMLGDPFTRVLRGAEEDKFEFQRTGQVLSNGLVVTAGSSGAPEVVFVMPGSSAEEAGIKVSDVLLSVDGKPIATRDVSLVPDLIKNEARLELKRAATGKTYRATLKPSKVTVSPVQYAIVPAQRPGGGDARVGYIRVVFFGANAFSDVKEAVTDLLSTGPPDAWILDLRANPGGIVYNGIEVSELFLEEGDVLCQVKYPREGEIEVVKLPESQGGVPRDKPLTVLVNGGTASVSEILTGALRDNRGALIVGEKTFGKGRTQRIIPLQDGSELLLSNAQYLTPSGDSVDGVGISPDQICVPEVVESVAWQSGKAESDSLGNDPCVKAAIETMILKKA